MMRMEIHRAVPEAVTVDDIVGVELNYTGDFFRFDLFSNNDEDITRYVDLKTGSYVSHRRCSRRETSKVLNADEVGAIRRIIADSGILDAELDEGRMLCDAGDHYITLFTGTDRYVLSSRMSVGFSFWGVWKGIMGVVALDDPPEEIRGW